jgi:hypothetical protein
MRSSRLLVLSGRRIRIIVSHGRADSERPTKHIADDTTSENWQSGEANRKRGREWLDQIYQANHKSTEDTLAAHQDFCTASLNSREARKIIH